MSTMKKSGAVNFWLVVLGLFLVIGFVAGGVTILDEQGLISAGGGMPEGVPPAAVLVEGSVEATGVDVLSDEADEGTATGVLSEGTEDETAMTPPPRDHDGQAAGVNSQALLGLLNVIAQLGLVVVVIAGGQWLYAWLASRRSHAKAA